MSGQVAPWARVPPSPGRVARSWAMVAKGENVRWNGGCVGRALIQQDSNHSSGDVFHGRGNPTSATMALVPMAKSTSVVLSEEVEKEVEHNEAVGNSLATFLMVDEDSLNLLHTTFARLLVVVDVTMGLPSEISITSSKGSWLQSVDYEGIPFSLDKVVGDPSSPPSQIGGGLSSDKGLDPKINLQRAISGLGCAIDGGSPLGGNSPQATCASEQKKMEGVMAELKLEDGSGSHGDCFAGFREGHHTIQKMDYVGIQNLKLLKNTQANGWIEVKRKKGKKGLFGSVCIAPPLEGGGVSREVTP
ncbi:hypothetical protein SUGI_1185110 [Cryptomeria japonica]|nr:hypothetical protein SUGI_1185110 [Cryptomeria japonica]